MNWTSYFAFVAFLLTCLYAVLFLFLFSVFICVGDRLSALWTFCSLLVEVAIGAYIKIRLLP